MPLTCYKSCLSVKLLLHVAGPMWNDALTMTSLKDSTSSQSHPQGVFTVLSPPPSRWSPVPPSRNQHCSSQATTTLDVTKVSKPPGNDAVHELVFSNVQVLKYISMFHTFLVHGIISLSITIAFESSNFNINMDAKRICSSVILPMLPGLTEGSTDASCLHSLHSIDTMVFIHK